MADIAAGVILLVKGHSVTYSVSYSSPSSPTFWYLGPRQYIFEDNSTLSMANQTNEMKRRMSQQAILNY